MRLRAHLIKIKRETRCSRAPGTSLGLMEINIPVNGYRVCDVNQALLFVIGVVDRQWERPEPHRLFLSFL